MTDDVEAWVLGWFRQHVPQMAFVWSEHASANYFETGWIDSFASVELVSDVEGRFQITFTESDLADPRFATMAGLAAIVRARLTP